MATYIVKHHMPGHINLDVPVLRNAQACPIGKISKALTRLPIFMGITDLTVNLGSGSVAIEYDTEIVDIMDYLDDIETIVVTLADMQG